MATSATSASPGPAPNETVWYGNQTLYADLGSLLVIFAGAALSRATDASNTPTDVSVVGGVGYLLAAPIVHLAHGRGGTAAADIALRLVMPAGGAIVGSLIGLGAGLVSSSDSDETIKAVFLGILVGALAGPAGAVALDAAVLAREPKPAPAAATTGARPAAVSILPTFRLVPENEAGAIPVFGAIGAF